MVVCDILYRLPTLLAGLKLDFEIVSKGKAEGLIEGKEE